MLSESVFNIYNLTTAVALLREFGFEHSELSDIINSINIVSTRYDEEFSGDVRIVMQMAKEKNALACSRAFDYVSSLPGKKRIFLMMNCLGDEKHWSENVCWLYDCDFEFLTRGEIDRIVATGPRCLDYKLRLLLAGVPEEKIICWRDELEAVEKIEPEPGDSVFILYGTDSVGVAQRVRDKFRTLAKEVTK